MLPLVLDPIVTALQDDDDDVRAVAASTLLPVAESVVQFSFDNVNTSPMFTKKMDSTLKQLSQY